MHYAAASSVSSAGAGAVVGAGTVSSSVPGVGIVVSSIKFRFNDLDSHHSR